MQQFLRFDDYAGSTCPKSLPHEETCYQHTFGTDVFPCFNAGCIRAKEITLCHEIVFVVLRAGVKSAMNIPNSIKSEIMLAGPQHGGQIKVNPVFVEGCLFRYCNVLIHCCKQKIEKYNKMFVQSCPVHIK